MIDYLRKTLRVLSKLLKNTATNGGASGGQIIRITATLATLRGELVLFKELQVIGAGVRKII